MIIVIKATARSIANKGSLVSRFIGYAFQFVYSAFFINDFFWTYFYIRDYTLLTQFIEGIDMYAQYLADFSCIVIDFFIHQPIIS